MHCITVVVRGGGARRVEDVDRINLSLAVAVYIDEDNENILIIKRTRAQNK